MKRKPLFFFFNHMMIFLVGCSTLQQLADIQKPQVSLDNVQITGLSFDDISLMFDVAIENPNNLSVSLAGFEYDFLLNENSFIQGQMNEQLIIQAQSKSMVNVPVNMEFSNIYSNYKDIESKDSSSYQLNMGLYFDIPVIGKTRIPLSTQGSIPLIKFPEIKVTSLKLDDMSLTSAKLTLNVLLDNPNAIGLLLNQLNYSFVVNGNNWISGSNDTRQKIAQNSKNNLEIPIQLNFLQMGQTAYGILTGNTNIEYSFKGLMNMEGNNNLLQNRDITIDQKGALNIIK